MSYQAPTQTGDETTTFSASIPYFRARKFAEIVHFHTLKVNLILLLVSPHLLMMLDVKFDLSIENSVASLLQVTSNFYILKL